MFGFRVQALLLVMGLASVSARADEVRYLATGDVALAQLFLDIRQARQSIDMTYYIWHNCHASTKVLLRAISEQKRKHPELRTRLMIDGITFPKNAQRGYAAYLRGKGIETRFFNVKAGYNPQANFRNHAKVTIVDREMYVTGGRNIADDYFGLAEGLNWIDRDVWARGESARGAAARYEDLWNSPDVNRPGSATPEEISNVGDSCHGWNEKDEALWRFLVQNAEATVKKAPVHSCSQVQYVMDDLSYARLPRPNSGEDVYMSQDRLSAKPATRELVKMLENSSSVVMENYVYIPPGRLQGQFERAKMGNYPIELYTNFFKASGEPVDDVANYYMRRDQRGSQRHIVFKSMNGNGQRWSQSPAKQEYKIHSKVFVTDLQHSYVSSFNIDPRSYHTNIESGVIAKNCPSLAREIVQHTRALARVERQGLCRGAEDCPAPKPGSSIWNWFIHELL